MLQNMANLRCSLSNADYIYTNSYCTAPERSQTHKYSSRTIQTHNTAPERSQTHNTAQEQSQTHNTAPKRYTIANIHVRHTKYIVNCICVKYKTIYTTRQKPQTQSASSSPSAASTSSATQTFSSSPL